MSKKSEAKKCPGVTKSGNPCRNNWNPNDPEGYCKRCRRRIKNAEKRAKKEEKSNQDAVRNFDQDPDETVPCVMPDCGNTMKLGVNGETDAAMTLNMRVLKKIREHSTGEELAIAEYLDQIRVEHPAGAICPQCWNEICLTLESFGKMLEGLKLPVVFVRQVIAENELLAERKRKEEEAEAKAKAEAEAARLAELNRQADKQRSKKENAKQKAKTRLAQLAAKKAVSQAPSQEEGEKDFQTEVYRGWLRDLEEGRLEKREVEFINPVSLEAFKVTPCAHPNCPGPHQGTMNDPARREDGSIIMVKVYDKEAGKKVEKPLPRMWATRVKLIPTYRDGTRVVKDGQPVHHLCTVPLCNICGYALRDVREEMLIEQHLANGHSEEEAKKLALEEKGYRVVGYNQEQDYEIRHAVTQPLSVAHEKALKARMRKDSRFTDDNGNGSSGSGPRRGRGKGGMQAHSHGAADDDDYDRYVSGSGTKEPLATLGDKHNFKALLH